jgi:hypothetical protein
MKHLLWITAPLAIGIASLATPLAVALTATTTTVTAAPNPVVIGGVVTYTVKVVGSGAQPGVLLGTRRSAGERCRAAAFVGLRAYNTLPDSGYTESNWTLRWSRNCGRPNAQFRHPTERVWNPRNSSCVFAQRNGSS